MSTARLVRVRALLPISTAIAFAFALAANTGQADEFSIIEDLAFTETVPELTLDLYLPEPADKHKPVPCIIVIQGGGFRPQNGQRFKPFAEHLANDGFAAALISYRGSPEHRHRDTLADVRAAVRFVRGIGPARGIDPERIGAMGRSAGGTLTALLAVNADPADPDSHIQAAVCFAGVFDFVSRFTDKDQLALQPGHKKKIVSNGAWIGTPFSPTDEDWLAASAITHVDSKDPPVLFLHSKDDSTVPWLQSRDMHRAMTEAGIASEIKIYETGGHSVEPLGEGENSLDAMTAFFRKQLETKKK